MPQATVRISGPTNAEGTSDATGHAKFPSLPVGTYTIDATHPDHEEGHSSAEVTTSPTTARVMLGAPDDWSKFRGQVSKDEAPAT